jgi:hypothetical protein
MYAYRDRKARKRDFRKLWIARINAGARMNDVSYSKLIHGFETGQTLKSTGKYWQNWQCPIPGAFSQLAAKGSSSIELDNITYRLTNVRLPDTEYLKLENRIEQIKDRSAWMHWQEAADTRTNQVPFRQISWQKGACYVVFQKYFPAPGRRTPPGRQTGEHRTKKELEHAFETAIQPT